jgi:hypothetical protein
MDNAFTFKDVQVDMSDIPSYASLDEATLYVLEANTVLFNNLKREIGLNELGVFETTGNTISYVVEANEGEEGESKPGLVDKAKTAGGAVVNKGADLVNKVIKLIEAAAAKIKGLFEAGMRKIGELTAKAASAFGKRLNAESIKKNLGDSEIKYKFGDYDNLETFLKNCAAGGKNAMNNLKKSLGDAEITSENVRKHFQGTVEERTLDSNGINQMVEAVSKFKTKNDAVKKAYKGCADHLNDIRKETKKASEINSEKLAGIEKSIRETTIIFGVAMSEYYKLMRNNVMVLIKANNKGAKNAAVNKAKDVAHDVKHGVDNAKAIAKNAKDLAKDQKAKKNAEKKDIEESAVSDIPEGSMTYTEEVESLFNWSF